MHRTCLSLQQKSLQGADDEAMLVTVKVVMDSDTENNVVEAANKLQAEIAIMSRIGTHSNIVQLIHQSSNSLPILLVMECCHLGNLRDVLRNNVRGNRYKACRFIGT